MGIVPDGEFHERTFRHFELCRVPLGFLGAIDLPGSRSDLRGNRLVTSCPHGCSSDKLQSNDGPGDSATIYAHNLAGFPQLIDFATFNRPNVADWQAIEIRYCLLSPTQAHGFAPDS